MGKCKEIVINCGNSHISGSLYTSNQGALTLEGVEMQTLSYDFSKEDLWLDQVLAGIELICGKLKFKGDARFIFPGSLLLTKTIRVPRVEKEKQDKIVAFELSQKMPFPLAELIWDYQIIDDDGVEQEILSFAVKPEVAESFCEKVVKLGLNPIQITPAPVLDFNAIKVSVPEELDETTERLVINLGAKSTNLLFVNPTGFLIRNISIGGNALTQNIADNLGVTFEKAEEIKKSYFSGEVTFSQDDPSVQVIENCAKQFLGRVSQEITRSIVTYKRVKKGRAPQKIYLTGRGSLLSNLPEYISQTQQIDIDYFDPMRALHFSESVSGEMQNLLPFMLSEPIGLAFSSYEGSHSQSLSGQTINLLPSSKISQLGIKKKLPLVYASLALLSLTPLPFYLQKLSLLENLESSKREVIDELDGVEASIEEKQSKLTQYEFVKWLNKQVFSKNEAFLNNTTNCWHLYHLLNELQSIFSEQGVEDSWYDDLKISLVEETKSSARTNDLSSGASYALSLSGRYLVRLDAETPDEQADKRERLIDANSRKQAALTKNIEQIPYVGKVTKKIFSIEGKGDLFNRHFTHFEYEALLDF